MLCRTCQSRHFCARDFCWQCENVCFWCPAKASSGRFSLRRKPHSSFGDPCRRGRDVRHRFTSKRVEAPPTAHGSIHAPWDNEQDGASQADGLDVHDRRAVQCPNFQEFGSGRLEGLLLESCRGDERGQSSAVLLTDQQSTLHWRRRPQVLMEMINYTRCVVGCSSSCSLARCSTGVPEDRFQELVGRTRCSHQEMVFVGSVIGGRDRTWIAGCAQVGSGGKVVFSTSII